MRRALVLFVWLVGILFPAAWLGRFSTVYRGVFNRIFGPEWMHVFMHLLLYGVLGILLLAVLKRTTAPAVLMSRPGEGASLHDRRLVLMPIGVVLAAGIIQESLQWMSQGVTPWHGMAFAASLYDLWIDLLGGLLGAGMVILWRVLRPLR